ncbi:SDR family oxidoreductase [Zhouia sp. PK063]|uniref:SDR family oxidoreductase n=1 Tax=Zhouia sp. PK063 TaxID=3373602 RepID=UPI0037A15FB3
MKVFVTGASGFVGSAVVEELIAKGYEVLGLARSESSAELVKKMGAEVLKGTLDDIDILKQAAAQTDGVIHTAFVHDFNNFNEACLKDKAAIEAMGEVLLGTKKPLITTSGTLGLSLIDGKVTEKSIPPENSPRFSEGTTLAFSEKGVNASVVRLAPSVHGISPIGFRAGFSLFQLQIAKNKGIAAYIGEGQNKWPAVHRLDAAKVFVLALERAAKGICYNAIGNEPLVSMRTLAEFIGKNLNIPVKSLNIDEAKDHFAPMFWAFALDNPATNEYTKEKLGWNPQHIALLEDMQDNFF